VSFLSLLFILVFLTLGIAVYSKAQKPLRNAVIFVMNLVFYAWAGLRVLALLLVATLVAWGVALAFDQVQKVPARRAILAAAVVALVAVPVGVRGLGAFGYAAAFPVGYGELPWLVAPAGVSIFSLQLVSYVCDVYLGTIEPERRFVRVLLYASMFHLATVGPLMRFEQMSQAFDKRSFTKAGFFAGTRRLAVGLAKAVLLALPCGECADALLPQGLEALSRQSTAGLWLGMLFYVLEVYLSLSALSDMALGMGRIMGFTYPPDFDHPYQAGSVHEFCSRWFKSLRMFFRDYVFVPLGYATRQQSTLTFVRDYLIVGALIGVWYGLSWNYVAWSLVLSAVVLVERLLVAEHLPEAAGRVLGHLTTPVIVFLSMLLLRFGDVGELACAFAGMFGHAGGGAAGLQASTVLLNNVFLLALGIIACTDVGVRLRTAWFERSQGNIVLFRLLRVCELVTPTLLALLSIIALVGGAA